MWDCPWNINHIKTMICFLCVQLIIQSICVTMWLALFVSLALFVWLAYLWLYFLMYNSSYNICVSVCDWTLPLVSCPMSTFDSMSNSQHVNHRVLMSLCVKITYVVVYMFLYFSLDPSKYYLYPFLFIFKI
jgi:hypothetical protein